jgi:fructose-1,6-bisphosphatase-3
MSELEVKYLKSIAKQYPTIASASTEIINLQAILRLPKGTEHFLSDIHGEHEQFLHVLKNGSGSIRRKIDDEFGSDLRNHEKKQLATLIYYPAQKLDLILKEELDEQEWYKVTLNRLIRICKRASTKYTRSKVRKALPADFAYIIEELITEKQDDLQNKEAYYNSIIDTIIHIGRAKDFIIALSNVIQRLVVDHLHIVGDIFDRGPGPDIILDRLMNYHSVDFQWGNHDIVWMGAAAGSLPCIANVIRMQAKYGNLDTLEDSYGINLIPLASFAIETYPDDECNCFQPSNSEIYDPKDLEINKKMHKAIAIIQFKLEGQLIKRRPEFDMDNRLLLDKIDFNKGTIKIGGKEYNLKDTNFPTINPDSPYELSPEEKKVMERLKMAFIKCDKLQDHVKLLFSKGSLYRVYNSNLLYHGCVPLNTDGTFKKVNIFGQEYSGKGLYDILEVYARKGYYSTLNEQEREKGQDIMWFTWSSVHSPVFGKEKMATFESYFLAEKELKYEKKNPYYQMLDDENIINQILHEFGLSSENSHIINGHMPVELKKGDTPVKCGGKLLIIDGGFSKAYQCKTGIAGYTLIFNSYGLRLVSHEPFESTEEAIEKESDIHSDTILVERAVKRSLVGDTDIGIEIKDKIKDLEELLKAYRTGIIIESR